MVYIANYCLNHRNNVRPCNLPDPDLCRYNQHESHKILKYTCKIYEPTYFAVTENKP
jgi:hypothetical protein